MKTYILPALFFLISACNNLPNDKNNISAGEVDMSSTGLIRLMHYYPEDTMISPQGDTTINYHTIPEVDFINQNGQSFSPRSMRGKISVNDFFFTTCSGICPVVNTQMGRIQAAFSNDTNLNLVSYTVDPEVDTVAALADYARRYKAQEKKWTFLTGDKKALYNQIRNGFLLPDVQAGTGDQEDFIHSDQIVLVDRNLVIRGYYTGTDSIAVDSLIRDIHLLLKEK